MRWALLGMNEQCLKSSLMSAGSVAGTETLLQATEEKLEFALLSWTMGS